MTLFPANAIVKLATLVINANSALLVISDIRNADLALVIQPAVIQKHVLAISVCVMRKVNATVRYVKCGFS